MAMNHTDTPTPPTPVAPPPAGPGVASPIVVVRAAATVLVVYGFLVGLWTSRAGEDLWLVDTVREWLNRPLGIGEDFGVLGVMLLLLAFGYQAAGMSGPERSPARLGLAALRLYLPVAVAVVLAAAALLVGATVWVAPDAGEVSVADYLGNLVWAPHLVGDAIRLVPLAWVPLLAILALALAAGSAPLRDVAHWVPLGCQLAATGLLVWLGLAVPELARLGVVASFLPLVILGQIVWSCQDNGMPTWVGVLLGTGCWAVVALAEPAYPELDNWWYPLTTVFAVLFFLVAVQCAGPVSHALARSAPARWLSSRCEWLLVLLGVVGFAAADLLAAALPPAVALPLALALLCGAAELCHLVTRARRAG
ncbi:hypothetical protein [Actinoalloteichus spitiensis]|uniref:hypothetical protein n=1 Tax=Actinoalloteichus spitiensis TaxID=252394 RepID=UPI00035E5B02|nr:hypothetical protein [Actinoalloteichus spitiensis]